ncbi:hypothetical protein [Lacticaseibacillus zhaodongensis]|uniref:hypothetical protein n=1 Tax=Lacticaseibacillus zhaodongensis TaxID=2668065 RepID=UPI0012D3085A|nr:hypothetical protein [Lacticaseibacillus zhaodongensis]
MANDVNIPFHVLFESKSITIVACPQLSLLNQQLLNQIDYHSFSAAKRKLLCAKLRHDDKKAPNYGDLIMAIIDLHVLIPFLNLLDICE